MMDETALLALKNAWNGAVAAGDRLRDLGAQVASIADPASVAGPDLETYHQVALAHANAALALRGLIEELRRKSAAS
jgi:hypothetical protein